MLSQKTLKIMFMKEFLFRKVTLAYWRKLINTGISQRRCKGLCGALNSSSEESKEVIPGEGWGIRPGCHLNFSPASCAESLRPPPLSLQIDQLTKDWTQKWDEWKALMEHYRVDINRRRAGVVIDSSLPHLMALEEDVLSTGVVLYHLKVSRQVRSLFLSYWLQGSRREKPVAAAVHLWIETDVPEQTSGLPAGNG